MMNTIAQPDPRDWYALPFEARDYVKALDEPLRRVRIAYSEKLVSPTCRFRPM